jgi:hypothetical protein
MGRETKRYTCWWSPDRTSPRARCRPDHELEIFSQSRIEVRVLYCGYRSSVVAGCRHDDAFRKSHAASKDKDYIKTELCHRAL